MCCTGMWKLFPLPKDLIGNAFTEFLHGIGYNNNNNNRFYKVLPVDFRNVNFMPYRFRPVAKVRPKKR